MDQITRIGMDTSKHFYQLHGVNGIEEVVLRRRLGPGAMFKFFATLAPTQVGIEACGGAHYLAQELSKLGHEVKMMAPQLAKPYVKRGKHDAADAAGLCEAMSRRTMRFVPIKSREQQAACLLLSVRDRLVRTRTQLANAIRAHAAEFGVITAKGLCRIEPLLQEIAHDQTLPPMVRELFAEQGEEYRGLSERLARLERQVLRFGRRQEASRRLMAIPSVGPIIAAYMVARAIAPESFASGRDFSAWMGLTPKNHSTANRHRLGGITRAGDPALRALLVNGATAIVHQARRKPDKADPWLIGLLARKSAKEAAVAFANKTARIIWKLLVSGESYRAPTCGKETAPA